MKFSITFILILANFLGVYSISWFMKVNYGTLNEEKIGIFYESIIKARFRNFQHDLKMDQAKRIQEQQREKLKKYLNWRVTNTNVLTDFYSSYF